MMKMKASNQCIEIIKKYEGCRLSAYKCPAGVWTIGYGHTANVKNGDKITQAQAVELLKKDITKYEAKVEKYNKIYEFSQNEFDSLVSFAFNIGSIDQLTQNGKRTKSEISEKILLYNKANGKILNGLTKRRKEERALFLKNENKKSNEEIAVDVIAGKFGNGTARKILIEKAGYEYAEIQKLVNKILKGV